MNTLRKPEDVLEQFMQNIETATDDQLVALLTEACDMTDYDSDKPISITHPNDFGSGYASWLGGGDECKLTLLTRLAISGQQKAFEVVKQALKGWSPSPSLAGSYIALPASEVFLVRYQSYLGAEEPSKIKASVQSGVAATETQAAWPYDDDGYVEALTGRAYFFDIVYNLDALTFGFLSSSAKRVDEGFEVELNARDFDGDVLQGVALEEYLSDIASDISNCSAATFGDRSREPSIVTLVFQ